MVRVVCACTVLPVLRYGTVRYGTVHARAVSLPSFLILWVTKIITAELVKREILSVVESLNTSKLPADCYLPTPLGFVQPISAHQRAVVPVVAESSVPTVGGSGH